jgi:hypothetical protein
MHVLRGVGMWMGKGGDVDGEGEPRSCQLDAVKLSPYRIGKTDARPSLPEAICLIPSYYLEA